MALGGAGGGACAPLMRPPQRAAREHDVGHALGRVGARQRARRLGHRAGACRDRRTARRARRAGRSASSRPAHQHGRAALDQVFGVARLVIVDRAAGTARGRADAGRAQLGDRQRAGAADHEVRPAVGLGHVVDERLDAAATPALRVGARRLGAQRLAAWWRTSSACPRRPRQRCGTTAFSARAPWLPPSTSRRIAPLRGRSAAPAAASAAMSARTGLPTSPRRTPRSAAESLSTRARGARAAIGQARRRDSARA